MVQFLTICLIISLLANAGLFAFYVLPSILKSKV